MSVSSRELKTLKSNGVLQKQVSLAGYTTWRVGGPAEWLAEPNDPDQIAALLHWAADADLPVRVIGAGSNLLIADAGLPGLTLCLRRLQGSDVNANTGRIRALSGEAIPTLARHAAKQGLPVSYTHLTLPTISDV